MTFIETKEASWDLNSGEFSYQEAEFEWSSSLSEDLVEFEWKELLE